MSDPVCNITVYLAAHADLSVVDAVRTDDIPVRDAFRRDGAMVVACSADLSVISASRFGKAEDVPEEWLPVAGVTLHPPARRP